MLKQSRAVYKNLINSVAASLIVSAALLSVLTNIFSALQEICVEGFGSENVWIDATFGIVECVVYFVSFTLPIYVFRYLRERGEREDTVPSFAPTERFSKLECAAAICFSLGAILLASYLNYFLLESFFDYARFSQEEFYSVELDKPYQFIIYLFSSAVVPALCEELLFRGVICRSLMNYGSRTAILVSAVLFALMHTNLGQLLYAFAAGLLLGWIYVRSGSLKLAVLLHFINNATVCAKVFARARLSSDAADAVCYAVEGIIFAACVLSAIYLLIRHINKRKKSERHTECDEDDGPLPLEAKEKTVGFFTPVMVMYIAYCVLTMVYYIFIGYK